MPDRITQLLDQLFHISERNSTLSREIIAGFTTFATMAYIIVVNPAILRNAGIPVEAQTAATILAAVLGCVLMAFYANRPFAIAPYMGENAFIAFTICGALSYKWQTALAAIFISGIIFVVLTLLRLRSWVVESIPTSLRYSFAVGIGLFLTFIGLNQTGIVTLGVEGAPVRTGALNSHAVLVAIFGLLLMSVLIIRKFPGAILTGIIVTSFVAFLAHVAPWPKQFISAPPSISPILGQIDLRGAFTPGALPLIVIMFIMAFVDTMGTLIGLSARAGFLDKDGHLPQIERPMLVDAVTTTVAPLLGTSTSGAYIESATGIEAGGRTGLTTLVVAACFAAALFFAPFFAAIPPQAYGPALIIVGLFMLEPITKIDFADYSESIPAFAVVSLMCFSFNLAVGISAGFILYPICKFVAGKLNQVRPGFWVLTGLSLLFFIYYPYK